MEKLPLIDYPHTVLEIVGKDCDADNDISVNQIEIYFKNKCGIGIVRADLVMVLNKIEEDGFIIKSLTKVNSYNITFKGALFSSEGGYRKQLKTKLRQEANQRWQTRAIVTGTFLAGLYGLEEITKTLYHHRHIFCNY